MKLLLAFVTITVVVSGALAICDWSVVQACLGKVPFIANNDLVAPKNQNETHRLCKEMNVSIKCIDKYGNRCLTFPLSKDFLNDFAIALDSYNKEICSTPAARNELQKQLACYGKSETKTMHILNKKFIAMLEKILSYQMPVRWEAFCCTYLMFRDAANDSTTKTCGKDVAAYINNQIKKVFGPAFGRECKRELSTECKLPRYIKKDFDAIINSKTAPVTKHKFVIPAILDLIKDVFKLIN